MPRECNYSHQVVQIVEAYRNAANYVVIFLKKSHPAHEQFLHILELYDSALNQFNESIRLLAVAKRWSTVCHNSLMQMQQVITTTGEGLVTGTIVTYNSNCPSTRRQNSLTHEPIQFVSNYLN